MYVIAPVLMDLLQPNTYCDMPDLFSRGLDCGLNLLVFPLHESWLILVAMQIMKELLLKPSKTTRSHQNVYIIFNLDCF